MIKKITIFLFLSAVIAVFLANQESIIIFNAEKPEIKKLSILAFGDMMLDRTVFSLSKKAHDFSYPFLNIDSFLKTGDLRVANLEGPITDYESISNGKNRMLFTISPEAVNILKTRFEVLSLANNHMLDFGEKGYTQTKDYLAGAGINYFGNYNNQQGNLSAIVEKNNIKIGFVGYHRLIDKGFEDVLAEIIKIRPQVDFLIIMPHWGAEYKTSPTEETRQKAKQFIDAGADLVLGSHPHVVQGSEEYKGKMIFYSLGNFIFDQYFSEDTMQGLGVEILLEKSDNEIKVEYKEHKILINKTSQPEIID